MKKTVQITESKLRQMITEAVMEATNGGWSVDDSEAEEAYNFAVDKLGKETIDTAIIRAMSNHVLAEILAYVFRMYDFREWEEYQAQKGEENRANWTEDEVYNND